MNNREAIRIAPGANDHALRQQGVVRRVMRDDGSFDMALRSGEWLEELLLSSAPAKRAIGDLAVAFARGEEPAMRAVVPGLFILPICINENRHDKLASFAMVATTELRHGEYLEMLCHAARLDRTIVDTLLDSLSLSNESSLSAMANLLRMLAATESNLETKTGMIEQIGRQLGESYEEIHLFHTLIGATSVSRTPRSFQSIVIKELLSVLPFAWIGISIRLDALNLPGSASGFMQGGDHDACAGGLQTIGERLLATVEGRDPEVIDLATDPRFDGLVDRNGSAIACGVEGDDGTIGVVFVGGKCGEDSAASSIETKLVGSAAEHLAVFLRNLSLYGELDAMFIGTVKGMVSAIDAKDRYTCGHSQRVSLLAGDLAAACGCDAADVRRVRLAGLVHDVGKIGVPEAVLQKTGRLNDEEFAWIKRHPAIGSRILMDIPQMQDILPAVLHHHERWDGSGYPDGLASESIPKMARYVALADAFDAMSSTRTYRSARQRDEVRAEILRYSGTQFDPTMVEPFLSLPLAEYDRLHGEHLQQDVDERTAA
jgi:hypothetical protein